LKQTNCTVIVKNNEAIIYECGTNNSKGSQMKNLKLGKKNILKNFLKK